MNVSVIIPAFNAGAFVADAIRSVLAQSAPAQEIIVVNDGSTDGTSSIVQEFGAGVALVTQERAGACRARNRGADLATGDAFMFLDADDLLGPDALAHLVNTLRGRPDGIAMCRWQRLDQLNGEWVPAPASCAPRLSGEDPLAAWLQGWYHPPCAVLWSRAAFHRAGGWDEEIASNQDGELMMRALSLEIPVVITGDGVAFYRRHGRATTTVSGRRQSEGGLRSRIAVIRKIAWLLSERGRLDQYAPHLAAAFDQLATDCRQYAPALESDCQRLAREFGGSHWRRRLRRVRRRVRTSLVRPGIADA